MIRVSLFGYGATTKSLAKLIPNAVFYDDKCKKAYCDENGFTVRPSGEFDASKSDLEITSPGIPPSNPLIKKARNLMSEYDFFAHAKPLKIWISGTNGKTTTTQMIQHLLKDKGSVEGGNIGTPLAELSQDANIWILESSSFTIHYTNNGYPNIYALLPISPDHLSWHGSMQEYEDAKLKPLKMMKKGDLAIIPEKYKNLHSDAKIITYSDEKDLATQFNINIEKIKFKGAFLVDAVLAMAVDKTMFERIDYEKINSFTLDPHRQEEIKDSKGRLWVNDTKATNLDATIAAVKRYGDFYIHLILGGDDKGVDLRELFIFLKTKDLKIYAIGSNKKKLSALCEEYKLDCLVCKDLKNAVMHIDKHLKKEEFALLSPAASSLDEFSSYAVRGNEFKKAVHKL